MTLSTLRCFIRILFLAYIGMIIFWVFYTMPAASNPYSIAILQALPLLLISPIFVRFKSPHLHIALPVILIYLCFTAPNLYLPGTLGLLALAELILNIILSSSIMWYQLQASKVRRRKNAQMI